MIFRSPPRITISATRGRGSLICRGFGRWTSPTISVAISFFLTVRASLFPTFQNILIDQSTLFRVRSVTKKMINMRLQEESANLLSEMGTVYSSYRYFAREWEKRAMDSSKVKKLAHANYAERFCANWNEYAVYANDTFGGIVGSDRVIYYKPPPIC